MGNSYEYLITSLPFLQLNVSPGINLDELNLRVAENVSASTFKKFQKTDFWKLDYCPTSAIVAVLNFKQRLTFELAEIRKAKVKSKAFTTEIFSSEFALLNPLDAELAINRELWRKMNELIFEHNFDISEILIYKLKLQLLERQFSFDADKGMEKIKALILSQNKGEE